MPSLRSVRAFFSVLSVLLLAAGARAQGSPRAGRVMSLTAEAPAVWVGPRRAWAPTASAPLSACTAARCAPVVETEACSPPACPGAGSVLTVAEDLSPLGAFPQDYDGYARELEVLRADASLAALHPYLASHPEEGRRAEQRRREEEARAREEARRRESVRWVSAHRERDRLELSLLGSVATLGELGGTFVGGTAAASLVFLRDDDRSDESDEDHTLSNVLFGDTLGAELRVHFLYRADAAQEAEWITAVGLGPAFLNRVETSVVRVPTLFGAIVPEVGMVLRADRAPTWYVGWSAPFSFLLTHDLALDAAARLLLVDDWIPKPEVEDADDPVETVLMLSLGFRLP